MSDEPTWIIWVLMGIGALATAGGIFDDHPPAEAKPKEKPPKDPWWKGLHQKLQKIRIRPPKKRPKQRRKNGQKVERLVKKKTTKPTRRKTGKNPSRKKRR